MSCFTYIVAEISGTGLVELNNIYKKAQRFQERVNEDVYNKYKKSQFNYGTKHGTTVMGTRNGEGINEREFSVPQITNYRHTTMTEALGKVFIDIVLLVFFTILFFTGAFVSFLRYDVR